MPERSEPDIAYLTGLVRAGDRPRYFATLFAPSAARPYLIALYAFSIEVARVPDQVSEPTLGEIRLEWWRDALHAAVEHGAAGETPVIRAIAETIVRRKLDIEPLYSMIDARSVDLYSDPPETTEDLTVYLGKIESALFVLAASIAGASGEGVEEAAHHAGIAYGLAQRLSTLARDRSRGRSILPRDLLASEELTASEFFAGAEPVRLRKVVAALTALARRHLVDAREQVAKLPRAARSAFLPLAIVEPLLARIDRLGVEMLNRNTELSDFEMLSRMAWARLRGSIS